jgi:hypothetical protein
MERKPSAFENFPFWMILVCNAVGWAIYAIGLFIMLRLGILWGVLYAAYCLWLEWRVISKACRSCYYYGKACGFGRGRLCSWIFSAQPDQSFAEKRITWWDIVPDFLVSLIPLGVGIAMLIRGFAWLILFLVIALVLLASAGTGMIRTQIACKFCRQRELGCPAERLFGKAKNA